MSRKTCVDAPCKDVLRLSANAPKPKYISHTIDVNGSPAFVTVEFCQAKNHKASALSACVSLHIGTRYFAASKPFNVIRGVMPEMNGDAWILKMFERAPVCEYINTGPSELQLTWYADSGDERHWFVMHPAFRGRVRRTDELFQARITDLTREVIELRAALSTVDSLPAYWAPTRKIDPKLYLAYLVENPAQILQLRHYDILSRLKIVNMEFVIGRGTSRMYIGNLIECLLYRARDAIIAGKHDAYPRPQCTVVRFALIANTLARIGMQPGRSHDIIQEILRVVAERIENHYIETQWYAQYDICAKSWADLYTRIAPGATLAIPTFDDQLAMIPAARLEEMNEEVARICDE